MAVEANSIVAYHSQDNVELESQKEQVLEMLVNGPMCDRDIAERLHIDKTSVVARRNALCEEGRLTQYDTIQHPITGRTVNRWGLSTRELRRRHKAVI